MILLILTGDYEIFGNGSGDVQKCLIQPTESLLAICNKHNIPITFFFDVCEYWAFKTEEDAGRLPSGHTPARDIEKQLVRIVKAGHDVQLHLHPQWLGYEYSPDKGWKVNFDCWRMSQIPGGILCDLFVRGKKTLEDLVHPHNSSYKCFAFRAGAWGIQPEGDILEAMQKNGFLIDSTAAPGIAVNNGLTVFDFSEAPLNIPAWRIKDNVCRPTEGGRLWEIPIFTFRVGLAEKVFRKLKKGSYASMRYPAGCRGSFPEAQKTKKKDLLFWVKKFRPYTAMLDFCTMTASEMCRAIDAARERFSACSLSSYPLVLIGHPKGFANEVELLKFFEKCHSIFKNEVRFGTYADWLSCVENENDR